MWDLVTVRAAAGTGRVAHVPKTGDHNQRYSARLDRNCVGNNLVVGVEHEKTKNKYI